MFVGSSDTVAAKIIWLSEVLGGSSRVSIQMINAGIAHETLLRGIELLGGRVAPEARRAASPAGWGVHVHAPWPTQDDPPPVSTEGEA
jgi:hypothetical protein